MKVEADNRCIVIYVCGMQCKVRDAVSFRKTYGEDGGWQYEKEVITSFRLSKTGIRMGPPSHHL